MVCEFLVSRTPGWLAVRNSWRYCYCFRRYHNKENGDPAEGIAFYVCNGEIFIVYWMPVSVSCWVECILAIPWCLKSTAPIQSLIYILTVILTFWQLVIDRCFHCGCINYSGFLYVWNFQSHPCYLYSVQFADSGALLICQCQNMVWF